MSSQAEAIKTRPYEPQCRVGAHWVSGGGTATDIRRPFDDEHETILRAASIAQVDEAIAAAKEAQRSWRMTSLASRAEVLRMCIAEIEPESEAIVRAITNEMGKRLIEAHHEVGPIIALMYRILEDAQRFQGTVSESIEPAYASRRTLVIHQPIGVAALISPWNFPVEMLANAVSALVMGNAVVWKPSEVAPTGPELMVKAFLRGGLPDGLLNIVFGGGDVGEHMVVSPDVGVVGFIGSTAVGKRITEVAGVKRLLLELGGNGPLIVMADADLEAAARAAIEGCFFLAGQVCVSSERILVQREVEAEFAELVRAQAAALTVGDPRDEASDMGSLVSRAQLSKVSQHVEDARAKGATILTGGEASELFYRPTVLTGVREDMEIWREETFGPVAPIMAFDTPEDALRLANDSPYGLQAAVFTADLKNAFYMAERIDAGCVMVNASNVAIDGSAPFGGIKQSGIGRILGTEGLRAFTNMKTIAINLEPG